MVSIVDLAKKQADLFLRKFGEPVGLRPKGDKSREVEAQAIVKIEVPVLDASHGRENTRHATFTFAAGRELYREDVIVARGDNWFVERMGTENGGLVEVFAQVRDAGTSKGGKGYF